MVVTPDVTLIFSDVTSMLLEYTPALLVFLIIALPARVAFQWFHNALEHKTRF
ncbi:MAG: hypothetical protein KAU07_00800 [Candidatus Andersenbacteria bacterium]|nr:hypothetical protein [Candidatus Andersenbacteria bacterium]